MIFFVFLISLFVFCFFRIILVVVLINEIFGFIFFKRYFVIGIFLLGIFVVTFLIFFDFIIGLKNCFIFFIIFRCGFFFFFFLLCRVFSLVDFILLYEELGNIVFMVMVLLYKVENVLF